MGSVFWSVTKFIIPSIGISNLDLITVIRNLTILSPLVWLGWFAAKQYGYASRIREDYAFKAASAMAYEGYRKAAKEIDPELQVQLLSRTILNMSNNPIRLFGSDGVEGSPVQEFLSKASQLTRKRKPAVDSSPPSK